MRFIALDFETANADLSSICQMGAAIFVENRVESVWSTLVNPEDYFDAVNVSIHGIDEATVWGAPTFQQLADELGALIRGQIVVSHSWFDRVALGRAGAKYGFELPACRWLDSARVVRRAWPERFSRKGCGLADVAEWCGIEFNHHRADEDARAAGEIILRAVAHSGLSVEDWVERAQKPLSTVGREAIGGNPDGPLAGEQIVFTGALSMPRCEAALIAAEAGCDVGTSVSQKTTLVVVGQQDLRRLEGHRRSSKHRKAEALIQEGRPIRILGEDDFRRLVDLHASAD